MKFVFGKGLMTLLQFRGCETYLSFCNVPECAKASIDSQEWRDVLAAAVLEFDRANGAFPFTCPECGEVPLSGSISVDANLTPQYTELFDDSG